MVAVLVAIPWAVVLGTVIYERTTKGRFPPFDELWALFLMTGVFMVAPLFFVALLGNWGVIVGFGASILIFRAMLKSINRPRRG